MAKRRILLLSEGFGAGHTKAAQATAAMLRRHAPDVQTRVLELGSFLHPTLMPLILSAYRRTLTASPSLYAKLYRSQYNKSLSKGTELLLHRLFYARTARVLRQLRPDSVVCTHPFPGAVISRLKRSGLQVPLYTVITDYDAHGTWVNQETDAYFVSTLEVQQKLIQRGVAKSRIEVTGIPVHPDFWEGHDRTELRQRLHLKEMPTVLVMGGGWGIVDDSGLFAELSRWRESVQLVIGLGNNTQAQLQLKQDPRFQHPNVHVLGYTSEMDLWMEAADLLITKPGGLTCSEAMAKGLPMLFFNAIPGQEETNGQYFIDEGLGAMLTKAGDVDVWMSRLTTQYPEMLEQRDQFRELQRNRAAAKQLQITMMNRLCPTSEA